MALISVAHVPIFNTESIRQGDCIRFRRATDNVFRNGIITRLDPHQMQVLFANLPQNTTSFMTLDAADAAIGLWEIWWTQDFVTVNYHPPAGGGGSGD